MTTEEQHAEIGKAHSELKAKTEKLNALKLRAHDLGEKFSGLGEILLSNPHLAGLLNESIINENLAPRAQWQQFERKIFDADKFKELTDEIKETMLAIDYLKQRLA